MSPFPDTAKQLIHKQRSMCLILPLDKGIQDIYPQLILREDIGIDPYTGSSLNYHIIALGDDVGDGINKTFNMIVK